MKPGDDILFYRSGKYIGNAKIAFSAINQKLAKYSWAVTSTGDTWELVYFLTDVNFIDIPSSTINKDVSNQITNGTSCCSI